MPEGAIDAHQKRAPFANRVRSPLPLRFDKEYEEIAQEKPMKNASQLVMVTVLAGFISCGASFARAQQYVIGSTLVPCVQQFYDQQTYGWLALQNNCHQALSVTFAGANSSAGVWGSMDLDPGRKKSTGHDRSAVMAAGGLTLYVCPKGYDPVEPFTHKVIGSQKVDAYTCKLE